MAHVDTTTPAETIKNQAKNYFSQELADILYKYVEPDPHTTLAVDIARFTDATESYVKHLEQRIEAADDLSPDDYELIAESIWDSWQGSRYHSESEGKRLAELYEWFSNRATATAETEGE